MGAMKQLAMDLRERRGPFQATSGKPLSWADINELTDSEIGTFTVPCPYCGPRIFSSRRFQIVRLAVGHATWHCFYCGEEGSLTDDTVSPEQEAAAQTRYQKLLADQREERKAMALQIWADGVPVIGTPVIDHLRTRAIHDLPPDVDEVLRYHSSCPFGRQGQKRCMLALFRDIKTNEPVAVHRTRIIGNGYAERMALGPIGKAAIKLWPASSEQLVIGEGIETVLSAALYIKRSDGTELTPAWSLTVAKNVAAFPLVRRIARVVILADNDPTNVGQRAAAECSQRWVDADRKAIVLTPSAPHKDFNDVIKGMRR